MGDGGSSAEPESAIRVVQTRPTIRVVPSESAIRVVSAHTAYRMRRSVLQCAGSTGSSFPRKRNPLPSHASTPAQARRLRQKHKHGRPHKRARAPNYTHKSTRARTRTYAHARTHARTHARSPHTLTHASIHEHALAHARTQHTQTHTCTHARTHASTHARTYTHPPDETLCAGARGPGAGGPDGGFVRFAGSGLPPPACRPAAQSKSLRVFRRRGLGRLGRWGGAVAVVRHAKPFSLLHALGGPKARRGLSPACYPLASAAEGLQT